MQQDIPARIKKIQPCITISELEIYIGASIISSTA
jgi:hypothetical protein